jgi:hypothetical protein
VFLEYVDAESAGFRLEVFPNPFVQQATVRYYASTTEPAHLSVLDQQGRLIWEGWQVPSSAGWQEWLLSEQQLPSNGLYFLRLSSSGQVLSHRILKSD